MHTSSSLATACRNRQVRSVMEFMNNFNESAGKALNDEQGKTNRRRFTILPSPSAAWPFISILENKIRINAKLDLHWQLNQPAMKSVLFQTYCKLSPPKNSSVRFKPMANYKSTYFFEICKNPCTKWDKYWVCDDASGNIPPERAASWIKHCPQWWLKSSLACKFTWSYKTPQLQWNINITKSQETCKICSLQQSFAISRFFYIYFTITGVKKITIILLFVKPRISLYRGLLFRGST